MCVCVCGTFAQRLPKQPDGLNLCQHSLRQSWCWACRSQVLRRTKVLASSHECALAAQKVSVLESALERRTSEWRQAEAVKLTLLGAQGRRWEQSSAHATERLRLQVWSRKEKMGGDQAVVDTE